MGQSGFHRGDYTRARSGIVVAMIEFEALEPRMQIAYKNGEIPAGLVADLSLARLMIVEVDDLLRRGLDQTIGNTGTYHDIYADSTYDRRQLVTGENR